jgi:hypothetical protein
MSKFLKVSEVKVANGGYLMSGTNDPVTNPEFVKAQEDAHYLVTLAGVLKGKDFKGKKADTLEDAQAETAALLAKQSVEFVKVPNLKKGVTQTKLASEALAYMSSVGEKNNAEKINAFMQKFEILKDFEEFGLFFDEGIQKLNKIYTIAEILEAVNSSTDHI